MIAVSSRSESFHRLAGYLTRGSDRRSPERVAWTATRNLPVDDPDEAAHFMAATADLSKRCKKPVYHLILSWHEREQPAPEAMADVADSVLSRVGLDGHEAVFVAHQDKDHPHLHVMVNRVSAETCKAWDMSHDYRAIQTVLREKEVQFGFRRPRQRADDSKAPTRAEHHIALFEQREPGRRMSKKRCKELRETLAKTFERAVSWEDLQSRLAIKRFELRVCGGGMRVVRDGAYAKLSDLLPHKLTTKTLLARLGSYRPLMTSVRRTRDPPQMRQYQASDRSILKGE